MQISLFTFTDALVARHQKITDKPINTAGDGREWQLVDISIPNSLRADQVLLQLNQQLKEAPEGDATQGGKIGKQTPKASIKETSRKESTVDNPTNEEKREESPGPHPGGKKGKHTQKASSTNVGKSGIETSSVKSRANEPNIEVKKAFQEEEAPSANRASSKNGKQTQEQSNMKIPRKKRKDSAHPQQTCADPAGMGLQLKEAPTEQQTVEESIEMSQEVEWETGNSENHEGNEVLQALMQEMHELAKSPTVEDLHKVEAILRRFAQTHIPNAKEDHSRTIGFIFLMTDHCLSCHIDEDNPFFYVMHAIISAALHAEKAAEKAGASKKWSVLCNMVEPAEVYSNPSHPLKHYIANCVAKQKILQPHNNALGYYQSLYQKRLSLKTESQTRLIGSVSLSKITSQGKLFSSQKTGKDSEPGKRSDSKRNDSNIKPEKKRGKTEPSTSGSVKKPDKTDKLTIKPKVRVRPDVSSPSAAEKTSNGKRRSPRNDSKIDPEKKRGKTEPSTSGSVQKSNKTDKLAIKSSPSVAEKTSNGKHTTY